MNFKLKKIQGPKVIFYKITGDTKPVKDLLMRKYKGKFQNGGEGGPGYVFFGEEGKEMAKKFMKDFEKGKIKKDETYLDKRLAQTASRPLSPGYRYKPMPGGTGYGATGTMEYPSSFLGENGIVYQVVLFVLPKPEVEQKFRIYSGDELLMEMKVTLIKDPKGYVDFFEAATTEGEKEETYEFNIRNGKYNFVNAEGDQEYEFVFEPKEEVEEKKPVPEKKSVPKKKSKKASKKASPVESSSSDSTKSTESTKSSFE